MKPSILMPVLTEMFKARENVLLVGSPGIGKTDIIKAAAEAAGAKLIISHPVVSDPTDFKGLPYASEGKADFLPFGELLQLIEADKPTVYFLDDLGQAPPSVQAAAMQLLLERRINGHMVSDFVTFAAATNRRQDQAGVQGILEPVKSRFAAIIELSVNTDDWVQWAINNNMPVELIAFIRFRPGLLNDFNPSKDMVNSPCPRTVAAIGRLVKLTDRLPKEAQYELFTGATGEAFAAEFQGFLQVYREMPDPDGVLLNPDKATIPDSPSGKYAISTALAHRASETTFGAMMKYLARFDMPEFGILAAKDAIAKSPELQHTTAFINWASDNKNVLL